MLNILLTLISRLSLLQSDQSAASLAPGDGNNNSCRSGGERKVRTLTASSAASVGQFYRKLQGAQGEVLGQLLRGEICVKDSSGSVDYPQVLENLSQVSIILLK